jgi:hypothetical protein
MVRNLVYANYQECFIYHGSTTIERIRQQAGAVLGRDWLIFNTVEEAEEFFNTDCGE